MAETVYVLCALTSLACFAALIRGFVRTRARLLLWSALCFAAMAINNVLLFVDKVIFSDIADVYFTGVHLAIWRALTALVGLLLLLWGLIWETDR
ncbi:MAG: DUF5985 family protein [Tepidisphaeraceae bacterium]